MSSFYVWLDQLLEQGLDPTQRDLLVEWYERLPEEWELHPYRWNVQRYTFVRYRRMDLPLTPIQPSDHATDDHMADAFAYAMYRGVEATSVTLDEWSDEITLPHHNHYFRRSRKHEPESFQYLRNFIEDRRVQNNRRRKR